MAYDNHTQNLQKGEQNEVTINSCDLTQKNGEILHVGRIEYNPKEYRLIIHGVDNCGKRTLIAYTCPLYFDGDFFNHIYIGNTRSCLEAGKEYHVRIGDDGKPTYERTDPEKKQKITRDPGVVVDKTRYNFDFKIEVIKNERDNTRIQISNFKGNGGIEASIACIEDLSTRSSVKL